MECAVVNVVKDSKRNEDPFQNLSEDMVVVGLHSLSKKLVKKTKPRSMLMLDVTQSQITESRVRESHPESIHSLDNRIPKHIVSHDEKYLRRCLELIYIRASKATSLYVSANLYPSKMGVLYDFTSSPIVRSRYACDFAKHILECPLVLETNNAVSSPAGNWFVGGIAGSKSMLNLLKSPLLCQSGVLDCDVSFRRTNLSDVNEIVCSDFMSSSGGLSINSSLKLGKENVLKGDHRYGSDPLHNRLLSASSTNSTWTDKSSSLVSASVSQGMLRCTWKAGFPSYVFSVYDQREIYVAKLFKAKSEDDKVYIYTFHSISSTKDYDTSVNELDFIGKMRVSTSVKVCPLNSEILETEFVLYGINENYVGEFQNSSHISKKNKGLPKKVMEVIKTSHPSKQRTRSKFGGASAILENPSRELHNDFNNNLNPPCRVDLSENHLLQNLELATIIVKDHIGHNNQEIDNGGWGLKFLKKVGNRQTNVSLEDSVFSDCCPRNTGDCSTSMDILIPAGFHGGPRTRNGGPSSLSERWRSGGHCDCGGWDLGCPLTVLKPKPSKKEVPPDMHGKCKSLKLFIQGLEQDAAIMKMVNVHDSSYSVSFQSPLSVLQTFSIAVAFIHTQTPTLRPKLYRS